MISGFIKNCANKPNNRALVINDETYSYLSLLNWAHSIKLNLNKKEINKETEEFIGIYSDHSINCYASILAILLSGSGFVPLNRKFPSDRLASIIKLSGIKKILCRSVDKQTVEKILISIDYLQKVTIVVNEPEIITTISADHYIKLDINEERNRYLLFTSGSTGIPKGIAINNKNFRSFLSGMTTYGRYDFNDKDSFLQIFELSFDVSIACIFLPWEVGACLVPVSTENIVFIEAMEIIQKYQVTIVSMAPSAIAYMQQLRITEEFDFPFIRYSFLTGEALASSLVEAWQKVAPNSIVENAYGPTEVTVWSFMYRWNNNTSHTEIINGLVPIGTPLAEVKYKILDSYLKPVADGISGELFLYGQQVASGYWLNEDQTAKSFIIIESGEGSEKWYKTGDIVIKNELGNVVYINRADNQVQINGFRVELGEIEYRIREFTKVSLAVVLPSYGINDTVSLVAFIEKPTVDSREIKLYLSSVLPVYMVPKKIISVDSMPLNNSGKVDRNKLKELINA